MIVLAKDKSMHKMPRETRSDPNTTSDLESLARKYKDLVGQSQRCEKEFHAVQKQLENAKEKCLGIGRQSALDRWRAGGLLDEVVAVLEAASYSGGFKAWCAENDIAYSTARQAKELHKNLTKEQVLGLTITDAVKLSAEITAANAKATGKSTDANRRTAAKTQVRETSSRDAHSTGAVLDSSTATNRVPNGAMSSADIIVPQPDQVGDDGRAKGRDCAIAPKLKSVHVELLEMSRRLEVILALIDDKAVVELGQEVAIQADSCITILEGIKAAAEASQRLLDQEVTIDEIL